MKKIDTFNLMVEDVDGNVLSYSGITRRAVKRLLDYFTESKTLHNYIVEGPVKHLH